MHIICTGFKKLMDLGVSRCNHFHRYLGLNSFCWSSPIFQNNIFFLFYYNSTYFRIFLCQTYTSILFILLRIRSSNLLDLRLLHFTQYLEYRMCAQNQAFSTLMLFYHKFEFCVLSTFFVEVPSLNSKIRNVCVWFSNDYTYFLVFLCYA